MAESPNPMEIRFREPLSEVTRKERTALLAVSAVAITVSATGLIPTKISALGIEFGHSDQASLLLVLQCIVGFFMAAFVFYAAFDFVAWRTMWHETVWNSHIEATKATSSESASTSTSPQVEALKESIQLAKMSIKWWEISTPVIYIRYVFEFLVPIFVSIFALCLLHTAKQKIRLNSAVPNTNSVQRPNP